MNWEPFELHTHTYHSDGKHSLLEMCREAAKLGLSGIALTDHNTISGLADAKDVQEETGVTIVPGMEWTTFYGHMLTLGAPYCEWRDLGPGDIHKGIERVHQAGGIVGIAHPFSWGSPICTGCHWDYAITDWNDIDYIEVWHRLLPPYNHHNAPAYKQWTDVLNNGFRLTATSGRDWHHSEERELPAFTYIGVPNGADPSTANSIVEAVRHGRCIVSMGPMLQVEAIVENTSYGIGDEIVPSNRGTLELLIKLDPSTLPGRTPEDMPVTNFIVESNLGELAVLPSPEVPAKTVQEISLEGIRWLRVRATGVLNGGSTTLAFTNPIYVALK
ncbi:CehA/McbA family metallohydrolase [Aureibacillus halotolerans]|uniref:PHP domain-containing protein n=1 Tax=Aureibacillus halotolerans TaxID=1508390 RepID=A0A4R6TTY5_9BACI|nr:CehA/McbA family metallohydrolase [Aureibacillus halotolerans]TDQ37168.1 PHP domain-containing protein [Aureibacillus halotolerans]